MDPRALAHFSQHLACLVATGQTGLSEGSKARKAGSHLLHPNGSHQRTYRPKWLNRNKSWPRGKKQARAELQVLGKARDNRMKLEVNSRVRIQRAA